MGPFQFVSFWGWWCIVKRWARRSTCCSRKMRGVRQWQLWPNSRLSLAKTRRLMPLWPIMCKASISALPICQLEYRSAPSVKTYQANLWRAHNFRQATWSRACLGKASQTSFWTSCQLTMPLPLPITAPSTYPTRMILQIPNIQSQTPENILIYQDGISLCKCRSSYTRA